MGEAINGNDPKINPVGTSSQNGPDHDPGTQTTSTKRRGRPPGSTRTTGPEETELLGLADVNGPKQVAVEIPTPNEGKKRGRPKKNEEAAAPNLKVDSTQIQLLLVTVSGLVASRPGMEVWNLTPQESKQIAEPLANIISKNAAVAAISNEHADAIALVVACFMVFVPKLLLYLSSKPKKPKQGETVNYESKRTTEPIKQTRPAESNRGGNDGRNTSRTKGNGQNFGGQLYELIPTVGGI